MNPFNFSLLLFWHDGTRFENDSTDSLLNRLLKLKYMKTIFTLLSSLFISASVLAADAKQKSVVTIKSVDNQNIMVVLDGKRFDANDNSIMISNLNAGQHSVKVYRLRNNGVFNILGKRYEVVYNSTVTLKKRTHLFITIERSGFISMQENKLKNGRDFDYDDDDYDFDDYYERDRYATGMNEAEFDRMLQSISREWLESNKIKSVTQVTKTNRFTTDQVKELMRLFTFENYRLEVAKLAYVNTVDKWNYSEVNTLFSYQASKTELDRYIRSQR